MKIKKNGAWENFILPVSVPTMKGASSTSDGTKGLVPQPSLGDQDKYLKASLLHVDYHTPFSWEYQSFLC